MEKKLYSFAGRPLDRDQLEILYMQVDEARLAARFNHDIYMALTMCLDEIASKCPTLKRRHEFMMGRTKRFFTADPEPEATDPDEYLKREVVAGFIPATAEASADAEGEEVLP